MKLENKVFQALGQVSMCWSETPKGVFESSKATVIGSNLMDEINKEMKYQVEKGKKDLESKIEEIESLLTSSALCHGSHGHRDVLVKIKEILESKQVE